MNTSRPCDRKTPLEFVRQRVATALSWGVEYTDTLARRTQRPEDLVILPNSLQSTVLAVTAESAALPEDLIHQVEFAARDGQGGELFRAAFPAHALCGAEIVLTAEPETVEDQEIAHAWGGMGNAPSYLIRLRPVLKIDGKPVAAGSRGFASGTAFALETTLTGPYGSRAFSNEMIVGNLAVQAVVCGRPSELESEEDKAASRWLLETALEYADQWTRAEDELAALRHLQILRPLPSVVTLGGVVDVEWLLDVPHGVEWKGVYVDADFRAVELCGGDAQARREFMKAASLAGAEAEGRVLETAFGVESVDTPQVPGPGP